MTSVFRIRIRNFVIPGNITGVTNTLETVTTLFRNVCNAVSFEMKLVQPEIQLNIFCDNHTYIFFGVPGNITGCNTRYRNSYQLSCDLCNAVSSLDCLRAMPLNYLPCASAQLLSRHNYECFTPLTCGLPLRVTSELCIPSNPPSACYKIIQLLPPFMTCNTSINYPRKLPNESP